MFKVASSLFCLRSFVFLTKTTVKNATAATPIITIKIIDNTFKLVFISLNINEMWISLLVNGVYRVVTWIVAVMLPPMAIFFPLFTILEDLGILPRIAFNLDNAFRKCNACGKQALTMCMGFGCNACGVTGTRIIDSPRDRLIAILTNNFVPCNGRFPTIISIITIFLVGIEGRSMEFNKWNNSIFTNNTI